jgi:Protein of unknown function (DUF3558)
MMQAGTLRPRRKPRATSSSSRRSLVVLLGLASIASCSKPSSSARAGGSRDATSIDACALLTPPEIQQALGVAVKPGVKNTTNTASQCQWDSQNESDGVGVSVSVGTYDDAVFKMESSAKIATPVSGYGDAAFKGWPHYGDFVIKRGDKEIDLGVVNLRMTREKVDSASGTLARLVLSRL